MVHLEIECYDVKGSLVEEWLQPFYSIIGLNYGVTKKAIFKFNGRSLKVEKNGKIKKNFMEGKSNKRVITSWSIPILIIN
jgi:hypothetical protein